MRYFCIVALVLMAPHVKAGPVPAESLSETAIETRGADIVRSCPARDDADSVEARDACSRALDGAG